MIFGGFVARLAVPFRPFETDLMGFKKLLQESSRVPRLTHVSCYRFLAPPERVGR